MNTLPQQLANGLFLGSMYGLIAIGYTMVYGIVQLINFAHGEIFMTGGFGALSVYIWLPGNTSMWLALPLMLAGGAVVAVLVAVGAERFAYRCAAHHDWPSSPPSVSRSPCSRPSSTGTPTPRPTASSRSSPSGRTTSAPCASRAATSSSSSPPSCA